MALGEWTRKCHFLGMLFLFTLLRAGDAGPSTTIVEGFRIENSDHNYDGDTAIIYALEDTPLRLFGSGFTSVTTISFTPHNGSVGENCDDIRTTDTFKVSSKDLFDRAAKVVVNLDLMQPDEEVYFFCTKESDSDLSDNTTTASTWIHQGIDSWMSVKTAVKPVKTHIFPYIWLQSLVIVILLCCSGTFSGLNLGLMSLDKTELKIIENSGTPREQKYAKTVSTVRKRGNYLLCTILLGNVLVNNTLAILMDDLTGSGMIAIVIATIGIVIFGEIVPQAVCSRYGLAIGARTIWFTRFFMLVTFPMSFPISKILDCVLGEELGAVYNRDRLRELLKITGGDIDLVKDEVNIIAGALELSKKTVADIMTNLDDVYMIEYNAILDFETVSEIMKTGYTRVPVYDRDKSNIMALLNIKDLAFVDPDDRTPLKTVCKFYNHPINFVFEDTKLDAMLEEFKKGQCHLAFIRQVNNNGPGDPFYETIGLLTLEDVIEEIIQAEIVDETDTIVDNRSRTKRKNQQKDFSCFKQPEEDQAYPRMSPQLTLATFQYLSTTVPPFKPELISENVLQRLLKQNVVVDLTLRDPTSADAYIYQRGKVADYFVLMLQGRVECDIGKEHMIFEGGAFMYFGIQALTGVVSSLGAKQQSVTSISSASDSIYAKQPQYVPDFTVKALCDSQYLRIARSHYIAARRATLMERQPKTPDMDDMGISADEAFNKEWQRAISVNEDRNHIDKTDDMDSSKGNSIAPSTQDGDLLNTPRNRSRSGTQGSLPDAEIPLMSKSDNNAMS